MLLLSAGAIKSNNCGISLPTDVFRSLHNRTCSSFGVPDLNSLVMSFSGN